MAQKQSNTQTQQNPLPSPGQRVLTQVEKQFPDLNVTNVKDLKAHNGHENISVTGSATNDQMAQIKEFVIYRGIPLMVGGLTVHFWGDDTKSRETIVFLLASFGAHTLLLILSVAREVDKLSDKSSIRSKNGPL